jgi:CelD/BcsL family acetyltransferase involved in cellulose biosynthesis
VEVTTPAPRSAWGELAATDPGTQPTQLPQWFDCVVTAVGGVDASRLYRTVAGRHVLVPAIGTPTGVPAIGTQAPGLDLVTRGWPHGWGYGGALTSDGELHPDDARLALSGAGRPVALWSTLVPSPWRGRDYERVAPASVRRTGFQTHVLDLDGGPDAVWSRFRHASRTAVRKAERAGLEITSGGPEQVAAFGQLYAECERRWATARGQPETLARVLARRRDRIGHVALVASALPGTCTLWVARLDGRPVAANVVLTHGEHALGWLSAMDADLARRTQGTYLLHWRVLVDACERGARFFNLGESDPGSEVARHKARLGAIPLDYAAYTRDPLRLTAAGDALRRAGVSLLAWRARRRAQQRTRRRPPEAGARRT